MLVIIYIFIYLYLIFLTLYKFFTNIHPFWAVVRPQKQGVNIWCVILPIFKSIVLPLWFDFLRRVPLIYDQHINVQWRNHPNQNTHTVHSLHIRECNSLWIGFIDALTTKEKELLDGSEQQFLKKIHERLTHTPYDKAKEYAHSLLLKAEPQKSSGLRSIAIAYVKPITPVFLWSLTRAIYLKIKKIF